MQKFRSYKKDPNFFRGMSDNGVVRKRIVNQEEIADFLKYYPGMTENEIMDGLYDYNRNSTSESNKKYAECLRRALRSGKISRVKAQLAVRKLFIYFAV